MRKFDRKNEVDLKKQSTGFAEYSERAGEFDFWNHLRVIARAFFVAADKTAIGAEG